MAAEWTDVVQQRALEVEVRCVHAPRVLADAVAYLAPPMRVAEAKAARGQIKVVLAMVTAGSDDLNRASNAATAAKLIVLRGAADDMTDPLPSIEHIPDSYHDARLALGLFQSAKDHAVDACNDAGRCCGHLQTALNLIDAAPGLPGGDDFLEVQRLFASANLEGALASSVVSAALAVVANWLVR